jgi:hypothetical protein
VRKNIQKALLVKNTEDDLGVKRAKVAEKDRIAVERDLARIRDISLFAGCSVCFGKERKRGDFTKRRSERKSGKQARRKG